jgi:hypothetical protein
MECWNDGIMERLRREEGSRQNTGDRMKNKKIEPITKARKRTWFSI